MTLLEPKRLEEVKMIDDSKYCWYHRIVSHPIEEFYVFKNIIEDMIKRKEIGMDGSISSKDIASSNNVSLIEGKIPVVFQVDN